MPKIVMSWYAQPYNLQPQRTEKIIRQFLEDLGDEGGVLELKYEFCDSPSKCDSSIVIEAHYRRTDDRDQIQYGAGEVLKERLEKLLDRSVSVRLLPKDCAIFIK